jgi:aminopeptidase N
VCILILLLLAPVTPAWGAARPFGGPDAQRHFTRPRAFDVTHVALELSFDAAREMIFGRATTALVPLADGMETVTLDAVDLEVDSVISASGGPLASNNTGRELIVMLDRLRGPADTVTFTVVYSARPRLGVYFVNPDAGYPDKPAQIWSQGEMEENRHWFPCFDAPNDFYTTEMKITVPRGQTAISNGRLVETRENAVTGTVTYHWRADEPHVTYLTSFAVAKYEKFTDESGSVPIEYYVDPRDADRAARSFAKTPDMMRFFSGLIGVEYPYPKYAQVTVEDFRWGGMENQSATTLTRRTLRDATALQDGDSDGLVAHELAHQWWGDFSTTVDWSHIWLNEGFATYFEALYTEHDRGADEFLLEMLGNCSSYLSEDSGEYRRAIVTNRYENPEQMFDSHSYPKGAWVLHMIRYVLGENRWVNAVRHYAQEFAFQNVDSEDFRKAIDEATGEPLDWFFDQWVYHGGHPEYEVSWDWDDAARMVALHVRQVQTVDSLTPLFRMPVEVEVTVAGDSRRSRLNIAGAAETFYLPSSARPDFVQFDPDERILKTVRYEQGATELQSQLAHSAATGGRIRAAAGLAHHPTDASIASLASALEGDSSRGVRAEAALSLGIIATPEARSALARGFADRDARVRLKVAEAFSKFAGDTDALALLQKQFRNDSSYAVRAACVNSAAKLKLPGAFEFCRDGLRHDSHEEAIRAAALGGMAELGDERGIDVALKLSRYGEPPNVRTAALEALGKLARRHEKRKEELRDRLVLALDDPDFRTVRAAAGALGELGDNGATAALDRLAAREADFRTQRAAREAIDKIRSGGSESDLGAVSTDVAELKRLQRELSERIERIEARSSPGEIAEGKGAGAP